MADVLSQSEVESLLAALDPSAAAPSPVAASAAQQPSDLLRSQVSVYDFKRPERVSKEQMRALQALHEGFSREFGAGLSGMLRTIIDVKLISVDQLTYSEFVFSLENPTCFNLLYSEGLEGSIILDLNPSIVFPIVDRLLGGGRESAQTVPNRPLTEIELQLVSRITDLAIAGFDNAWKNICKLDLSVKQVESNPQIIQIVPPNEVIVLISFEVTMGEMRGIMNLCIPFNTIEPLAGKLSSDTWASYSRRASDPQQERKLAMGIAQAKVELIAELASTHLTTGDVANLAVGDVILTEQEEGAGLILSIENRTMYRAEAGLFKGHKAVRVTRVLEKPHIPNDAPPDDAPAGTENPTDDTRLSQSIPAAAPAES